MSLINENETKTLCLLENNSDKFNMKCEFNYDSNDIINITYKPENGYLNLESNSKDTIYINNDEITTYTLKTGYIVKQGCENYIYKFRIENNILYGKNISISNQVLHLNLEQFNEKAKCLIDKEWKFGKEN